MVVSGIALFTAACISTAPDNLGVKNGKFSPCPDSPKCVSSQAKDPSHRIDAIKASGSAQEVMQHLTEVIKQIEGSKIIKTEGPYLYAEFRSKIFRYVDDFECFYDEPNGLIEVKSSARLGYYDFSVNRDRVEKIRELFKEKSDRTLIQ